MTSLCSLKEDYLRLVTDAKWLINSGFSYKLENDFVLKFKKNNISIEIYYGRYSDSTDVLVEIDSADSERYENGRPYRYSVFEAELVNSSIIKRPRIDGYDTAKYGLELLKRYENLLFDLQYLKKVRSEYEKIIHDKLPDSLKNLTISK